MVPFGEEFQMIVKTMFVRKGTFNNLKDTIKRARIKNKLAIQINVSHFQHWSWPFQVFFKPDLVSTLCGDWCYISVLRKALTFPSGGESDWEIWTQLNTTIFFFTKYCQYRYYDKIVVMIIDSFTKYFHNEILSNVDIMTNWVKANYRKAGTVY